MVIISILPPLIKFNMSSSKIAQLEAQLWKVKANKARWEVEVKTVEEWWITEEKVAAEARGVAKGKVAAEVEE